MDKLLSQIQKQYDKQYGHVKKLEEKVECAKEELDRLVRAYTELSGGNPPNPPTNPPDHP